jgi:hypothetical protein
MQLTPTHKRIFAVLAMYGLIILAGHYGGEYLRGYFGFDNPNGKPRHATYFLVLGTVLYIVFLALPFIPGIEISVALFAAFGKDVILIIYLASIVSLSVSYLVGRLFSVRLITSFFRFLRLDDAADFSERLEPLTPQQRLELLVTNAPARFVPFLIRYRYIALAVALNIPGNAIIGGGGGIAMVAGISGLFRVIPFVSIIAIAVIPIPLAFYILGK